VPETVSPAVGEGQPPDEGTSRWVWIALFEREGVRSFIYGCAAQSFHSSDWHKETRVEISGGGRLIVRQVTVDEKTFSAFQQKLDAGAIDPGLLFASLTFQVSVAARRVIFREALGQSGVRTDLYYTLPDMEALVAQATEIFGSILSVLQEQLNLPFKDAYAGHIGNFEIFELHPWLDGHQPFLIEFAPDPDLNRRGPQTIEICRSARFSEMTHTAHLIAHVNREIIIDRLIRLPSGATRVPVQVQEMPDQLEFRLFGEDGGTLLHSEHRTFMNRIGLVMAPVHRQMTIQDDLSNRAESSGRALGTQASTVTVHSSQRSMIGALPPGSWRKFAEDMEQMVATYLPKPAEDKWFPRGVEGEIGAIAHLNHLINAGQISGAVLVDPWFGADALQRFVLRLGSHGLPLTILTSWTDIDPDTDKPFEPGETPTDKLGAALERVRPFLTPRLTVLNLVDGKARAFHDRYLLLHPHEQPAKVFLLSNSINKLAGNWPFAMSLLAPDVGREVQRYIEALCDGRDIARNKSLTINFKWPPDAA
jgi:hypothetical protein